MDTILAGNKRLIEHEEGKLVKKFKIGAPFDAIPDSVCCPLSFSHSPNLTSKPQLFPITTHILASSLIPTKY
jgi:hypothetical protein